jgi:hypothetical protein
MGKSSRASTTKKWRHIQIEEVRRTVEKDRTEALAAKLAACIEEQKAQERAAAAAKMAAGPQVDAAGDIVMNASSSTSEIVVPEPTTRILQVSSRSRARKIKKGVVKTMHKKGLRSRSAGIKKLIGGK